VCIVAITAFAVARYNCGTSKQTISRHRLLAFSLWKSFNACFICGWQCFEIEKECDGLPEPASHARKLLERRNVPTTFDKTQKINGHSNLLGERFLSFPRLVADLPETAAKLLSEAFEFCLHQ